MAGADRESFDHLRCPGCSQIDEDFDLLDYRLVRCSCCGTKVRVTHYRAFIGGPDMPFDNVEWFGIAA